MATTDRRGVSVDATDTPIAGDPNPGLAIKAPARAATTANIALSGLQTIDGVALAAGDRVLVWKQTDATTNGLYNASTGNWTRTVDLATNDQLTPGMLVGVSSGTAYNNQLFMLDGTSPLLLGTSNLIFVPAIGVLTAPLNINGANANALTVGPNLTTNPTFRVDTSAVNAATGLLVKGAAAGSGLALSVLSSGTNEALTIDAKGTGGITLGGVSTGPITLSRALVYGGVTLSNAVTGTGKMVLDTSPALTTPSLLFGTGAGSTIGAVSFNTGFANILQSINSGTASNAGTSAQVEAVLAGGGAFITMVAQGGPSLSGSLITRSGLVGGLNVNVIAGSLSLQTNSATRQTIQNGGNIGFGTEINPQGAFVVSQNATTGLQIATNAGLTIIGADGVNGFLAIDSYNNGTAGNGSLVSGRAARGTGASPANLQSGDNIVQFGGRPYVNGAFASATTARIVINYSDTSPGQGTYLAIEATPNGGGRVQAMRVQAGVIIGSGTVDPGANNLIVGGTLQVTGTTTLSAALTYGGVTLSNAVTGTGKMVLDTSPTIATPTINTITSAASQNLALNTAGTFVLLQVGGANQVGISSAAMNPSTDAAVTLGSLSARWSAVFGVSLVGTTSILSPGTGGIGYSAGAGGTVTQASSRTTGVTLNKTSGDIKLVSAAGSATHAQFTVTNSTVALTDTISISQQSGADKYILNVTNVANGSFQIDFATTGGTTTEQPVFHFNVIKGVNS